MLEPKIKKELNEKMTPLEVFHIVTELDDLVSILVRESNLYAQQNGRNFTVTNTEMQAFLGINYKMSISKLPTIAEYWRVDSFIGNPGIQNAMTRNRFWEVLQNLHFADNTMQTDKVDKAYKVRPLLIERYLLYRLF